MRETSPDPDDRAATTSARFSLGDLGVGAERRDGFDEDVPGVLGGRYDVGRLLGSGGSARVYRAYDQRLDCEVAIKVFDRDAVAVEQRRRLREMSIQGSIDHPAVVALRDSGTERDRTYLVMQLVDGENLAERLLHGPLTPEQVRALAVPLAGALVHMHERGVIHRDLKPANVLLGADGPVIADFGIAHALNITRITVTGTVPGTAAYMAPEQVLGDLTGPPADVYALGLVLLECLTAEREYPGTMAESAVVRLNRQPRIPDHVPADLAHVIERMTAREPKARPTAAAVLQYLSEDAPAPLVGEVPSDRPGWWRRRAVAAAALAAGTVGVAAVVAPLLLAGPGPAGSTPAQPPGSVSPTAPGAAQPPASDSVRAAAETTHHESTQPDPTEPTTSRPGPSATDIAVTTAKTGKPKKSDKGRPPKNTSSQMP